MNRELIKKIFLPLMVFVLIIQIWSGISKIVEDFPTPSDTYVAAFGGVTSQDDELVGV